LNGAMNRKPHPMISDNLPISNSIASKGSHPAPHLQMFQLPLDAVQFGRRFAFLDVLQSLDVDGYGGFVLTPAVVEFPHQDLAWREWL